MTFVRSLSCLHILLYLGSLQYNTFLAFHQQRMQPISRDRLLLRFCSYMEKCAAENANKVLNPEIVRESYKYLNDSSRRVEGIIGE